MVAEEAGGAVMIQPVGMAKISPVTKSKPAKNNLVENSTEKAHQKSKNLPLKDRKVVGPGAIVDEQC